MNRILLLIATMIACASALTLDYSSFREDMQFTLRGSNTYNPGKECVHLNVLRDRVHGHAEHESYLGGDVIVPFPSGGDIFGMAFGPAFAWYGSYKQYKDTDNDYDLCLDDGGDMNAHLAVRPRGRTHNVYGEVALVKYRYEPSWWSKPWDPSPISYPHKAVHRTISNGLEYYGHDDYSCLGAGCTFHRFHRTPRTPRTCWARVIRIRSIRAS
eukprot:TRINITY_DN59268_c0_g1_i1.p1 TRINITY_DN59268_c0_g1~~TRINITY_DN59268_c0_g1_i1.p1  ORF type:complete len:233 (+),score=33.07 TRINITY_DN59268_c0_g1_i1:62-700(+)